MIVDAQVELGDYAAAAQSVQRMVDLRPEERLDLADRPELAAGVRILGGEARARYVGTEPGATADGLPGINDIATSITKASPTIVLDADTLEYQFTVDDPDTFTQPWTVEIPLTRTPGPIFEYACHEGNYGMQDVLAGARAQEKEAVEAKTPSKK